MSDDIKYNVGDIVTGRISGIQNYGAFVTLKLFCSPFTSVTS